MIYYVETEMGCTLVEARNTDHAYNQVRREVGTYHRIGEVRKATAHDIAWVRAMGGYVPEHARPTTPTKSGGA